LNAPQSQRVRLDCRVRLRWRPGPRRSGPPIAFSLAILSSACSSGGAGSVDAGGAEDLGDGGDMPLVGGGGGCPARADAATCPAPPAGFGFHPPPVPPNAPAPSFPALDYWVGCEFTNCSSQTSCTTCTCVDADGGAAWDCSTNGGFQPEADASPTPYCALYAGPLDADVPDAGPVERCTPQYPTCTGPYPESPGWQCCVISSVGGISEIRCMPNDAGPYSGGFPHP